MTDRLHDDRNMTETIAKLEAENKRLRELLKRVQGEWTEHGSLCTPTLIAIRKEIEP